MLFFGVVSLKLFQRETFTVENFDKIAENFSTKRQFAKIFSLKLISFLIMLSEF